MMRRCGRWRWCKLARMSKSLLEAFSILTVLLCSMLPLRAQVVAAGTYTNMRYTTEHCQGYSVQLWNGNGNGNGNGKAKAGDQMYGLLRVCDGPTGDTPVGLMEHVRWNAGTGELAFDAKLTTGMQVTGTDAAHMGETPEKDFFRFEGKLTGHVLSGRMTHEDRTADKVSTSSKVLQLRLDRTDKPDPNQYATAQDWLASNTDMLKANGPKW